MIFWLLCHVLYVGLYMTNIVSHVFLSLLIVHALIFARSHKVVCPSSFILANFSLYVVVPSFCTSLLAQIGYQYQLQWIGKIAANWTLLSNITILQTSFVFVFIYYSVFLFERSIDRKINFKAIPIAPATQGTATTIKNLLMLTAAISILMTFFIFFKMGGPSAFWQDYSTTFLQKRAGLGVPIIFCLIFTNIAVLLLGLIFFSPTYPYKYPILILALFVIFFNGYIMGFKSRIVILFLIFCLPKLVNVNLIINFYF